MRAARKGATWTKADDAKLRGLYGRKTGKELAALLKRTPHAVYHRAGELGLQQSTEQRREAARRQLARLRRKGVTINGDRVWTKADLAKLKRIYAVTPGPQLAEIFGRRASAIYGVATKLGLKKDPELVRKMAREAIEKPGHPARGHRFQPGHQPFNKGLKGWTAGGRAKQTQFKPGQSPVGKRPLGSLRISDGFLQVKVADTGYVNTDWRSLHRALWELKNGPVPEGHFVTFADGNRRNFAEENLRLISRAENCRRNSIHNLPPELKETIQQIGRLNREINRVTRHQDAAQAPV